MGTEVGFTRPDWVRRLVVMGPSIGDAADMVPLDADELVATASRATGLTDFGPPTWEEPFRRLVDALDTEASLHVLGRLMTRHDLQRHLQTRLRVTQTLRDRPAIADEEVVAPVFITGPARSGTSILQELLAQDPGLRAPLAWELAFPIAPRAGEPDERVAWAECEFDLWCDVQEEFRAVHELSARLPEECLWLFAPEFDSGFWATCADIPSFMAWRAGTDMEPPYRFHQTMLRVLQHGAPARPWVLKSPVHQHRLATLFSVYPDARVIQTHRDPVRVVPSAASTVAAGRWLRSDSVDPLELGASIAFGMGFLLNGVAEQRSSGALPEDQIADLHHLDLLRDPVAAITGASERLGLPIDDALPDLVTGYLAARPQDKHGTHRYSAADFGLDVDTIRAEFAPYTATFGVELEPAP
ncbi:MAG: sulfotransferase [Acidimicrobiia bacterium]